MLTPIPATLMRGGSSKGLYFHTGDLPADRETRDRVLLAAMGSPDLRQIDGLGGGHPLTSKVAVIGRSARKDADVDYRFYQVRVDKAEVSDSQNCGNILAGIGPWAIENGLVAPTGDMTPVRIFMENSGALAVAHAPTPAGVVDYEGEASIDGVPGAAAPILIEFLNIAGSSCGALLPTGNAMDEEAGVPFTCIDNGMPVVILRASDFGLKGDESPASLEADANLEARIEKLRLSIGPRMNLGDVSAKTVPKMILTAPPFAGGAISTRSFIPHRVHEAIGVLGAVSVATACLVPGSLAAEVAAPPSKGNGPQQLDIEHPSGAFAVEVDIEAKDDDFAVKRAALIRTARKLMRGKIFIPASVWRGQ